MVDTGPDHYNNTSTDQPLDKITCMPLLPNLTFYRDYKRFPWSICFGCGMSAGKVHSPDTWSRSIWDLHKFVLRPISFPNLFSGLGTSNIPWYFLDFPICDPPLLHTNNLMHRDHHWFDTNYGSTPSWSGVWMWNLHLVPFKRIWNVTYLWAIILKIYW